jgi:hypothetical protein
LTQENQAAKAFVRAQSSFGPAIKASKNEFAEIGQNFEKKAPMHSLERQAE